MLFELCLFWYLPHSQILGISLYYGTLWKLDLICRNDKMDIYYISCFRGCSVLWIPFAQFIVTAFLISCINPWFGLCFVWSFGCSFLNCCLSPFTCPCTSCIICPLLALVFEQGIASNFHKSLHHFLYWSFHQSVHWFLHQVISVSQFWFFLFLFWFLCLSFCLALVPACPGVKTYAGLCINGGAAN